MVQSEQHTRIEQDAIEGTRAFAQAMVAGDIAALEELLAPAFTYTHKNARVEPREDVLQGVRDKGGRARMDVEELEVSAYPGAAIVTGLTHMRVDLPAGPLEFDSRFSAVWVDARGKRRLALYHSTGVPED